MPDTLHNHLFYFFKYSTKEIEFGFQWAETVPGLASHEPLWGSALLPGRSQPCLLVESLEGTIDKLKKGSATSCPLPTPSHWKYFRNYQKEGNCSFSLFVISEKRKNIYLLMDPSYMSVFWNTLLNYISIYSTAYLIALLREFLKEPQKNSVYKDGFIFSPKLDFSF